MHLSSKVTFAFPLPSPDTFLQCNNLCYCLLMSVCLSWSVHTVAGSRQSSVSVCSSHRSTLFYAFIFRKSGLSINCAHDGEIFYRHNSIPNVDKYSSTFHGSF